MTAPKILLSPSSFAATDSAPLTELQRHGFEIVNNPYGRKLTEEELRQLLPGVIGTIAGLEPLNRKVLAESNLKVISRCGIGLDNVDLDAARDLGIQVFNTPDAPTLAVAELTVGIMLTLPRWIKAMDLALHEGKWDKRIGMQLQGRTVAIIGFGRIGKKVAELLRPFDVRLLIFDPHIQGPTFCGSLAEALSSADIVSLHASGNSVILGPKEFDLLKPGAFVLNASRGQLLDEKALLAALGNGRVAGVWLDTFAVEPYQGPLSSYQQVIMTPHATTYSAQCRLGMETEAVKNLLLGLAVNV